VRPQWHSGEDEAGWIKVVMTAVVSEPKDWPAHIGKRPKARRTLLAKRAKDPHDPLRLVNVRDMWLPDSDAPCMHTMYVDKPMKGRAFQQIPAIINLANDLEISKNFGATSL
jgi:type I restriction enzyme R subunit